MASGSFKLTRTGSTSSYVDFIVYWNSQSNGIEANSSTVHVDVYVEKSKSSTSNTWGTTNTSVSVTDGGTLYENGLALNVAPGASQLIFAKNFIVPHNVDGKKSITISVDVGGNVVWGNGSAFVALDTIPRHASLTAAPNFNDEENPTINYSNPAGDAITSIQACIASSDGLTIYAAYRDISKTGSSYTFELTDEEREVLRNATLTSNTLPIKFYVTSAIGGTTKYSALEKVLTITNAMPEITISAKDVGAASVALTGDENKIIKGFNYVLSSMSSKLKKGATIKSQTITNGSQSLVGEVGGTASMEGGFNNAESATFIFGLTDSRGNTVNKYLTLDMIDYVKLTCNLTVEKPTVDGVLKFNVSGNYFNDTFGAQYNYLALEYRTKKEGEDWSGWTLIDSEYTLQDNKYSVDATITGLDYRKRYTVQTRAQDRINLIPSAEKSVKAMPVYDWGENDFNFNVPVTFEGKSLIDLIYPVGSIYMAVNYFDPATIFGGEWERIMDKFLLGSGAIYASGQEGGEATHILTIEEMPSHNHGLIGGTGGSLNWGVNINNSGGTGTDTGAITSVGGGQPHNNMPPYLTVNIWKRIA